MADLGAAVDAAAGYVVLPVCAIAFLGGIGPGRPLDRPALDMPSRSANRRRAWPRPARPGTGWAASPAGGDRARGPYPALCYERVLSEADVELYAATADGAAPAA
jgi:hypothetical protein